jgi:hypothetical protein
VKTLDYRRFFLKEFQVGEKLNHRNWLKTRCFGESKSKYFILELIKERNSASPVTVSICEENVSRLAKSGFIANFSHLKRILLNR